MNHAFDWGLIRSFLAALEHGSLLAAARALGTTQPTLGRHITQLESQLGVVLFERTGRGLRLAILPLAPRRPTGQWSVHCRQHSLPGIFPSGLRP
jgi:hypothetical protein